MEDEKYESGFVDKILGDIFYTTTQKIRDEITNIAHADKNTYILTVACRSGETAFFLAKEFGCDVIGIDFFAAHIKEAEKIARREKLTKKVTFKKCHAENMPFDENTFDLVILERSLSCYYNKPKIIEECVRVLKKGGTFAMADFTVDHILEEDKNELKELTCLATALSNSEYMELMKDQHLTDIKHIAKEDIAEKNTKILMQKWKKIRLFSNIFLKVSSVDAGKFEIIMRKGEKIIKERRLGYMLFYGKKA